MTPGEFPCPPFKSHWRLNRQPWVTIRRPLGDDCGVPLNLTRNVPAVFAAQDIRIRICDLIEHQIEFLKLVGIWRFGTVPSFTAYTPATKPLGGMLLSGVACGT